MLFLSRFLSYIGLSAVLCLSFSEGLRTLQAATTTAQACDGKLLARSFADMASAMFSSTAAAGNVLPPTRHPIPCKILHCKASGMGQAEQKWISHVTN